MDDTCGEFVLLVQNATHYTAAALGSPKTNDSNAMLFREKGETRRWDSADCVMVLDQVESQSDPTVAATIAARQEVDTGSYQIQTALNYIEYAVQKGDIEITMPSWAKGETIVLNLNGPVSGI